MRAIQVSFSVGKFCNDVITFRQGYVSLSRCSVMLIKTVLYIHIFEKMGSSVLALIKSKFPDSLFCVTLYIR